MKYLFVVAHPDDEVLGAGGTIYQLSQQKHEVAVAILVQQAGARKDLSSTLLADQENSMKILGVQKVFSGYFPNIKMNTVPHLDLVKFVETCIIKFTPDVIVTHHPADTNNDHTMTSYATQAACRLFQRREDIPPLRELLFMEVLSSTEWSVDSTSQKFTPNCFFEIGNDGIEKKLNALREYKGVMREYPHPRSEETIRALAVLRGSQAKCLMAEAFESVYRRI